MLNNVDAMFRISSACVGGIFLIVAAKFSKLALTPEMHELEFHDMGIWFILLMSLCGALVIWSGALGRLIGVRIKESLEIYEKENGLLKRRHRRADQHPEATP